MSKNPPKPIEVFFSYAHEDEDLRDELEKHLSMLKRQGVITGWHDRKIGAGREWEGEIDTHLNTAHVILLLISADFLASDYCYDVEMERAMERHEAGEARVIPVILRPVVWKGAPFGKLQALPKDALPVTEWPNRDKAFENVAQGIQAAVEELTAGPHLVPEKPFPRVANVERLIKDIQSALYGDNSRLPYVLTLCLDLCNQVDLSEEYSEWLRRELKGYEDYKEFLDDEGQFDAWVQKRWASHRLIRPYIKGMIYSKERMRPEILALPIKQFLVAFPVAEIARMIQDARDGGNQEFSHSLLSLGQEHFAELQAISARFFRGVEVPPDIQISYSVADLEKVLNGVRSIVLSLLGDARRRIAVR